MATQLCDQRWLLVQLCVTPARANLTGTVKKTSDWLKEIYSAIDRIDNIRLKPIIVGLVVFKCLLDRLFQTQQKIRLTALAAMQLAEAGPSGGQAAAYLLRVAENQV